MSEVKVSKNVEVVIRGRRVCSLERPASSDRWHFSLMPSTFSSEELLEIGRLIDAAKEEMQNEA